MSSASPSSSSSASSSASSSQQGSQCASPNTPGTPISPPPGDCARVSSPTPPPLPAATPSRPMFNPCQSPNYSFIRPRCPSPYMRTVLLYVDAVNARDFTALASVFDEALEHRILPKSMARPVLTKRQYVEYWKGVMALFAKFETKIHEVIEAGDKLTVHGSTRGKSWSGTPYTNEYVLMLQFAPLPTNDDDNTPTTTTPTGPLAKIRYLKEFVDSSVSLDFFKEESERRKKVHGAGSPPRLRLNSRGLTG